jgi:hypothetical protein
VLRKWAVLPQAAAVGPVQYSGKNKAHALLAQKFLDRFPQYIFRAQS